MMGKILKVNDYKFEYGKETVYVNVYAGFKDKKSGNKYVIYSYDNKELRYGTLFIKDNEIVVMASKNDVSEVIGKFVTSLINDKVEDDFEIVAIDKVNSIQIIDDVFFKGDVPLKVLFDKTIPKPKVEKEEVVVKTKKSGAIIIVPIFIIILCAGLFFFLKPEIFMGKSIMYNCTKNYRHSELPAYVNEKADVIFNGKGKLSGIDITYDYVFSDSSYYKEFKDKSYFYKYFDEGDTYKFNDESYTFKLFKKMNIEVDFFLPTKEEELIDYYKKDGYNCKNIEMSEQ